ncbi:MAG: MXAN_5187 C-terminal domain-containing protein [Pseudomonadota bacterium]
MAVDNKNLGKNYVKKQVQSASDRISNKIVQRNEEILRGIAAFDVRLVEVHRMFEMYFLGLERQLPEKEREDLRRSIMKLRSDTGGVKTNILFKLNTSYQRFTSYDQLWGRTIKQIEEGTYHRDVTKAKRRAKKLESDAKLREQQSAGETEKEKPAPARAAAPTRKPASTGLSDDDVKRIYDTYVMARKRTGESTKVSMESLGKQLKERATTMSSQHNADVEFKVVIKSGKALIKAVPKS